MKKKYKAFISYKYTTSRVFAQNLELAIKAYAKPIWAPPMRIFRDEKYLSPGLNLPNMIEDGLNQSEYLIYLASPEAVASVWVEDEFKRWLQKDPALEKLIIVLTDGSIAYDSKSKKIDWQNTNVLPEILKNTLVYVPFYIDCHTFQNEDVQTLGNAEFKRAINQIHARIMGIDPIEMSGIEVKQYRSNLFKRNILLTSFGLAVIGAGISYMNKLEQEKLASSNLFVATSQMLAQGSKPQVGKAVIQAIKGVQLSLSQISVDNLQAINAFLPSHSWEFEVKNDSDDRSLGAVKVREKDNQRQVVLKHSANNAVVLDIKTGKQLSSIEYSKTFSLKEAVTDEKVYPTYDPQDGIVAEQHGQYIQLQNVSKGQIAASLK